jgi:hypothetical protein
MFHDFLDKLPIQATKALILSLRLLLLFLAHSNFQVVFQLVEEAIFVRHGHFVQVSLGDGKEPNVGLPYHRKLYRTVIGGPQLRAAAFEPRATILYGLRIPLSKAIDESRL